MADLLRKAYISKSVLNQVNMFKIISFKEFVHRLVSQRGRDSSVGIATRYWTDGPGIESRWGRDFPHPSRPALRLAQTPTQWVPGLYRG